jgi:hypothetical protein
MKSKPQNAPDIAQRLAALERQMKEISAQLLGIQEIVSSGNDVLYRANANRFSEISTLTTRVNELEGLLMPAILKVFPRKGEFIDEVDALLRQHSVK